MRSRSMMRRGSRNRRSVISAYHHDAPPHHIPPITVSLLMIQGALKGLTLASSPTSTHILSIHPFHPSNLPLSPAIMTKPNPDPQAILPQLAFPPPPHIPPWSRLPEVTRISWRWAGSSEFRKGRARRSWILVDSARAAKCVPKKEEHEGSQRS